MAFKQVLIVFLAIVLTFALMSSGVSLVMSQLTEENSLRSFVTRVSLNEGKSAEEANTKFNDLYYRAFPCLGVLQCMRYPPEEGAAIVLISNRGHAFFTTSMYLSVLLVGLCIILILAISSSGSERLLAIGIPSIFAGTLVLLKPITQGIVVRAVPPDTAPYARELLVYMFTVFTFAFLVILLIGLVLTLIGALAIQSKRTTERKRTEAERKDVKADKKELKKERKEIEEERGR